MEAIGGLGSGELITLAVLAVVLLGILGLLRVAFKLTATVFKLGCAVVFLLLVGAAIFMFVL